ncbi:MAG: hypothetical protein HKN77_02240 [Woeseiaceae bacterium]|nr:hypothetical protein [Woeseiaceae bacterium]
MKKILFIALMAGMVACTSISSVRSVSDGHLTFIHMNDTYRIDAVEGGNAGGFGRVVTLLRNAKADGRDIRITHGGDFLYPSLESQLWHGQQIIEAFNFMNGIAPMLVIAGNHEFDRRTPEHLSNAVLASEFEWLGDNFQFKTGNKDVDGALKSVYLYEHAGKRVGVFALTVHSDDGGNKRDYVPVDNQYAAIAEKTIVALEQNGADVIFGLTHLHMWQDIEIAKLKARHPKFLFIVGGHEHEPQYSPASAVQAAVMKGASNARVIWQIDVEFIDDQPRILDAIKIAVDERVESAADYDEISDKWRAQLLQKFPFLTATIGYAAEPLDGREFAIRERETNWGNLVTDQMRRAFGKPDADLAFINSGTLRIDDFIVDRITFEDVGRTFGFSSYLRYLTLSGAEFRTVLEAGYRGDTPGLGHFPQVSGFRVCADRSRPEGSRIVSLQVPVDGAWQEISADDEYRVVVPDFLYGGGDGYTFPKHRKASRPGSELKYLVLDAIMAAQAQGKKVSAPVDPANPRIKMLKADGEPCFP